MLHGFLESGPSKRPCHPLQHNSAALAAKHMTSPSARGGSHSNDRNEIQSTPIEQNQASGCLRQPGFARFAWLHIYRFGARSKWNHVFFQYQRPRGRMMSDAWI